MEDIFLTFMTWLENNREAFLLKRIHTDKVNIHYVDANGCISEKGKIVHISCQQRTDYAFGEIGLWYGDNMFLMDFNSVNMDETSYFKHYEFTDKYLWNLWMEDYIDFMNTSTDYKVMPNYLEPLPSMPT